MDFWFGWLQPIYNRWPRITGVAIHLTGFVAAVIIASGIALFIGWCF